MVTSKKLAVFGGGGHGKVVASVAESLGHSVSVFDDAYPSVTHCGGRPILGNLKDLKNSICEYDGFFVAIGNNEIRYRVFQDLKLIGCNPVNLVSKTAAIDPNVEFGQCVLVVGNAAINADSNIADGVIINTNAVVEHDCSIGEFSHICPNSSLAGGVQVGTGSWVGLGSSIIQNLTIGNQVTIGAGSVVIKNLPDNVTVVGNPARII